VLASLLSANPAHMHLEPQRSAPRFLINQGSSLAEPCLKRGPWAYRTCSCESTDSQAWSMFMVSSSDRLYALQDCQPFPLIM